MIDLTNAAKTAVVSTEFKDLLNNCPIFPFQFVSKCRRREIRPDAPQLHSEAAVAIVVLSGAGYTSMQTNQRDRESSARQLNAFFHLGDDARLCVLTRLARYQENVLIVTGIQ